MKKIIIITFTLLAIFVLQLKCSILSANDSYEHKYALIIIASSRGEKGANLADKIDTNGFFLGGVAVYSSLRTAGFKPENIMFLYADGDPDISDKIAENEIKQLVKEQKIVPATGNNIIKSIDHFAKKVTENDLFVMYLGTHGATDFVEVENGNFAWHYRTLSAQLNTIKPKVGLFYSDACHSGAFITHMNKLILGNYILISTTGADTYGWGDRYFSGGKRFFSALVDFTADSNVDGKITIQEAINYSAKRSDEHFKRIDTYLKNKYQWRHDGGYHEFENGKVSWKQTVIGDKELINKVFLRQDDKMVEK